MNDERLIECVPNFSEGRDKNKIDSIADAMRSIPNVELLHIDSGYDANRSVYTLVGSPEAILDAVISAFRTARQLCNMTKHLGTHPRIGLLDVCPLVPLQNISLPETVVLAEELAIRLADEFDQTIYLYEAAAKNSSRKNLADIRLGEYEGLERKLKDDDWQPDFGSNSFLPKTGASIIGARPFLVAFNVNLRTSKKQIASAIARSIRESGYAKELTPGGLKQRIPGLLPSVKALGWYVDEYKIAQVTMNLVDFEISGMHEAYEACRFLALELGVEVSGSEVIGLVPLKAILHAGRYYATRDNLKDRNEFALVQYAIEGMGLSDLKPFDPKHRIIEYRMAANSKAE